MDLLEAYQQGNAFGRDHDLQLKVIGDGHIEYLMPLKEKHLALQGVVHGGVIAGLMDAVLSVAALTSVKDEGQHVATVEFKINYLRAPKSTGNLKAIGQVLKRGKRVIIVEGEIFDSDLRLIAKALGTIAPVQWNKN